LTKESKIRYNKKNLNKRFKKMEIKKIGIGLIIFYQRYISPFSPSRCRFYPTCSEYTLEAIQRCGLIKGSYMGIKRILRCNPFNPGGYDPVL